MDNHDVSAHASREARELVNYLGVYHHDPVVDISHTAIYRDDWRTHVNSTSHQVTRSTP
jgi:hypothetical protein